MRERILVICDKKHDVDLLHTILGPKGFDIDTKSSFEGIEDTLLKDEFSAILADYDWIGSRIFNWIDLLQKNRCKSFFILYGEHIETEKTSEILQAGVYGFVPRALLPQRIYDTLLGGLENRKAFVEILGMINGLENINGVFKKDAENVNSGLTEAPRQKEFSDCLKKEFHRAKRYNRPLSLMMLNVSNLKIIIESLDNQASDFVLERLAECLKDSLRLMDILSRYDENGFVILLPETEMVKAETLAKRLVSAIKNDALWWNSRRIEAEITYGISATSELKNHETEKELISKANDRLQKLTCSSNVSYNAVK